MINTNIVEKNVLRLVQKETLEILKDSLKNSFGPMGSYTAIKKGDITTKYTKDGHTILKDINFTRPIEFTVKEDLVDLTRHIVLNVGDGTTSATILSSIIFNKLMELEKNSGISPAILVDTFKDTVRKICSEIRTHKNEPTPEDMYKIAYISTNGNKKVSNTIKDIYDEFGMGVFIDVTISNTSDSMIKIYDGMTLESGFGDNCFINNSEKGISRVRNPHIYVFEDPIDTPEMVAFLEKIILDNIVIPYQRQDTIQDAVPTVILTPKLSRDTTSYLNYVAEFMVKLPDSAKPPLLIISNIYNQEQYMDIAQMCGAKVIKKYIDPRLQEKDIQSGLAPTPETIHQFSGFCELVEADVNKSKFINPERMYNEDGTESDLFIGLVNYLEAELKSAKDNGEDVNVTGNLKRRINSLKSNMVEYLVGGVAMSDRDSLRDLVEDAVLNCRSAAQDGFGYGANFEGLRASKKLLDNNNGSVDTVMNNIIYESYVEISKILYETINTKENAEELVKESLERQTPYNIVTKSFDNSVLSSIQSDIVVLDTISKIITLIVTCNQYLCQTPAHANYLDEIKEVSLSEGLKNLTNKEPGIINHHKKW